MNPLQYGFRKGRGTTSSLALLYELVARKKGNPDDHHKMSIVSRDISGAFDRVWHEKLIQLFHNLQLPPLFIKVMASFLSDREICIKIFNYIGPSFSPTAGVPQGAPDSPDQFNISTLPFDDLIPPENTYAPWYCDDLHLAVATPCRRANKAYHKYQLLRAIKNYNNFESKRGILTCVEKSIIIPLAQKIEGNLTFNHNGIRLSYPYLPPGETTKILGLNISARSFTTKHVTAICIEANQIVSSMYKLKEMKTEDKLILIKAFVISKLTYPDTILCTCSPRSFLKLQRVLNRALKFAYNIHYPVVATARSLSARANILPLNQIIYIRAKKMWHKIESGTAADLDTFTSIRDMPINNPHFYFPSSLNRIQKAMPPPIFTVDDCVSPNTQAYYN